MTRRRFFRFASGFTLLELSLVVVVMGVLGLFFVNSFSGADDVRVRRQSRAQAEVAREALRAYLLTNKRLPCPDTDTDGYEDGGAAGCTGTGETGTLPYLTLGLPDAAHNRMFYGVYRVAPPDDITLDITLQAERTGDAEGAPGYLGLGDVVVALQAIVSDVLKPAYLHSAGIDAAGAADCAAAHHPVFILIVPNTDRDGDGNVLDAPNAPNGKCFASPEQPMTLNYDDVVAVESPSALIGWVTYHIN
ncbi:MAG: prepilin-type N-terminal cleavage/methylation domain-containing protein [Candidatus Accumulibacter sp.]|jgi:prepilin-type N-terminal cleavage/methylation domain-containing protein|nr:prepilin-type N-terminal cleavage/methylation domain-containing protein [Accumulibacter sp.]